MVTSPALLDTERSTDEGTVSLLVTWQDPRTRRYDAVGILTRAQNLGYTFSYLEGVGDLEGFIPFPGFSEVDQGYQSSHLFPLFAERVLDDSRPDRLSLLQALDLVDTAGPMEFLARSGGRRAGDTIELLPIPEISGSRTSCTFLVHGIRYQPGADEAIDLLVPGQSLGLESEPSNEYDPRAVLVTKDGTRLGWVPGPLLDYVRAVMGAHNAKLRVVRANRRELGHHMRLLVRLDGNLPDGYELPW